VRIEILSVAIAATLLGCGSSGPDGASDIIAECTSQGTTSIVVDVCWLEENLGDPSVQVVDTRPSSSYSAGHILGAIHLRPERLATSVGGVPSQISPAEEAETVLRAAGLRQETIAVVYGDAPEYDPARVVWALRYYGHRDVRYLDGGYAAWQAVNGATEAGPPASEPTDYRIEAAQSLRVTGQQVLGELGDPPYDMASIQLVDARSPAEFEDGHIPGARLAPWTENLEDGFLRPEAELRALYDWLEPSMTTVTYCVTGWRGAFAWLTLQYLGYDDVRLYDGSWAEWGDGSFPVAP
jgi:thiosulfate/3-mercaptopyruvate sulfurtransferase